MFRSWHHALLALLVTILSWQTAAEPQPPVAAVVPKVLTEHNDRRIDNYFWLRDDSRSEPKVLRYLQAENQYADAVLRPYQALRETLYQ